MADPIPFDMILKGFYQYLLDVHFYAPKFHFCVVYLLDIGSYHTLEEGSEMIMLSEYISLC